MASLTYLLMALLAIMLRPAQAGAAQYINSCESCKIIWNQNAIWLACDSCLNVEQQSVFTSINLNECFTNWDGQLNFATWGNFQSSCKNFDVGVLSTTILSATCQNSAGDWVSTAYDMNTVIGNYDGSLVCPA